VKAEAAKLPDAGISLKQCPERMSGRTRDGLLNTVRIDHRSRLADATAARDRTSGKLRREGRGLRPAQLSGLLRKTHTLKNGLKARLGAQGIEPGVILEPNHADRVRVVGIFQLAQRSLLLA